MQRQLIRFALLTVLGVSGLYLAYPDVDSSNTPAQPSSVVEPVAETAAIVETRPVPEPVQISTPIPTPVIGPVTEPRQVEVPVATNTFVEGQGSVSCSVPPTETVTRNESNIYTWTDADGQLHFSDKKPASASAEVYNGQTSTGFDYFDLAINYRGQNVVPFLRDQLSAQATSIYDIMTDLVGREQLRHVQLNILMFPDAQSFHQYAVANIGGTSPNMGGYYSTLNNEAVTFTYPDDNRTMEVAKHESTHVIAMGVLGTIPLWLNEGLAEYFSKLTVRSQITQVGVHEEWLPVARATVASGYPQRFAEFLKLEPEGWRSELEPNHYALAWSLVYYMLSTGSGRQALATMMQQMTEQYCQPLDTAEALARSYPGGLNALEKELKAWLLDDAVKAPHTY
jgi:hypothetical protein